MNKFQYSAVLQRRRQVNLLNNVIKHEIRYDIIIILTPVEKGRKKQRCQAIIMTFVLLIVLSPLYSVMYTYLLSEILCEQEDKKENLINV